MVEGQKCYGRIKAPPGDPAGMFLGVAGFIFNVVVRAGLKETVHE